MNKPFLKLASAAVIVVAGAASTVAEEPYLLEDQPMVLKEFDRFYVDAPNAADFAAMTISVFDADNQLVFSTDSTGEPVELLISDALPDGEYRYEVVALFAEDDLAAHPDYEAPVVDAVTRSFGTFRVWNGAISQPEALDLDPNDASLLQRLLERALNLAGRALEAVVPTAHAQATFTDTIQISTVQPQIWFDDTQDEDCSPGADWWFVAEGGSTPADDSDRFILRSAPEYINGSCGGSIDVIRVYNNGVSGAGGSEDSLVVDADGDIHWAQGLMNFDKGLSALSIGTTGITNGADLNILANDPTINLREGSNSMGFVYDGSWLNTYFFGASQKNIFRMNAAAPADSLVIESSGNIRWAQNALTVGFGAPAGSLVVDSSGNVSLAQNALTVASGAPSGSMAIDSAGDLHWASNKMNFDTSSSALSIGTTAVYNSADLTINAPTPNAILRSSTTSNAMGMEYDGTWLNSYFFDGAQKNIFRTHRAAPQNTLTISAEGNIGLNKPAPERQIHLFGSNAVFRMDRTTDTAAFLLVRVDGGGTPLKSFFMGTNASGSNEGEFVISDQGNAVAGPGTRRMTITNSGQVNFTGTVTAPAFTPTSSIRFKENIQPIENPLALAQMLQGVRFDWKDSGKPAIGLIAEEVEAVLPEVVAHDPDSGEVMGLNYDAIVPLLLEALKEQQRQAEDRRIELEEQEREIAALKVRIATFESYEARLAELEALVVGQATETVLVGN